MIQSTETLAKSQTPPTLMRWQVFAQFDAPDRHQLLAWEHEVSFRDAAYPACICFLDQARVLIEIRDMAPKSRLPHLATRSEELTAIPVPSVGQHLTAGPIDSIPSELDGSWTKICWN